VGSHGRPVRDRVRLGGIEGGRLVEVEEGIGVERWVASGRGARGGERWRGVGKVEMAEDADDGEVGNPHRRSARMTTEVRADHERGGVPVAGGGAPRRARRVDVALTGGVLLQEAVALVRPLAAQWWVELDEGPWPGCGAHVRADRQLFTPFARLGAEQSEVEGTGLGLALSQRLTEAMGGTLSLECTGPEGSTFRLELSITADPLQRLAAGVGVGAGRGHGDSGMVRERGWLRRASPWRCTCSTRRSDRASGTDSGYIPTSTWNLCGTSPPSGHWRARKAEAAGLLAEGGSRSPRETRCEDRQAKLPSA
jgi:hypothetical protein